MYMPFGYLFRFFWFATYAAFTRVTFLPVGDMVQDGSRRIIRDHTASG